MLRELLADEAGSACACGHWQGMLVPAHGTQVCRSENAGGCGAGCEAVRGLHGPIHLPPVQ